MNWNKLILIEEYIMRVIPLILIAFFTRKLQSLTCIDTTNQMYMILICIGIIAYVINTYWDAVGQPTTKEEAER